MAFPCFGTFRNYDPQRPGVDLEVEEATMVQDFSISEKSHRLSGHDGDLSDSVLRALRAMFYPSAKGLEANPEHAPSPRGRCHLAKVQKTISIVGTGRGGESAELRLVAEQD